MDPEAREPGLGLSGPKATAVRAHGLHRGLRVHVAMLLLGPGMNLKLCASQGTFSGQAVQSCPCQGRGRGRPSPWFLQWMARA